MTHRKTPRARKSADFDSAQAKRGMVDLLHRILHKDPTVLLRFTLRAGELAERLLRADRESKKLLKLLNRGSLSDFSALEPISGLTLLCVCADLKDDLRERAGRLRSEQARIAVEARHSRPGGSRDKRKLIRALWESGAYRTKSACAEAAETQLGVSFVTAIKTLRGLTKPTR